MRILNSLILALVAGLSVGQAAVITVTTTNNAAPPADKVSLLQALAQAAAGDTIKFNIAEGTGPYYIPTPLGGYAYIRVNNLTIDGYSQPGSSANTNLILAANNAKIRIVLDSRNLNFTPMNYTGEPGGSPGYSPTTVTILGLIDVSSVRISGLAFLGVLSPGTEPASGEPLSLCSVSFANRGGTTMRSNHVAGCWFGVDPKDGTTVAPTRYGVTGWGDAPVLEDTIIGVKPGATDADARASFNVFCGQSIPVIIEGDRTRVSGNFIGVKPDGLHDYNITLDPVAYPWDYGWEGHLELGDHSTAWVGTDGDGVNDAHERNVFGGGLHPSVILPGGQSAEGGYERTIGFYGGTRNNIVIAGNYIGVAVNGSTRFTNATTVLDATGGTGRYRFGSNFDGVSDDLEGNVVFNNWPPSMIPAVYLGSLMPEDLRGFWSLDINGSVAYRGNKLVNNNPFPMPSTRSNDGVPGAWLADYYAKVLADPTSGVIPVLSPTSTASFLIGTVPIALPEYVSTVIDLYLADSEGIQTGKAAGTAAGVTNFPSGFVQGEAYLASFVVDGPQDQEPASGAFKFSLMGIDLKGGKNLTVAATYSQKAAGSPEAFGISSPFSAPLDLKLATPVTIASVAISGQNLSLSWSGGNPPYQLQSRSSLNSEVAWQNVGTPAAATTATVAVGPGQNFYRVMATP